MFLYANAHLFVNTKYVWLIEYLLLFNPVIARCHLYEVHDYFPVELKFVSAIDEFTACGRLNELKIRNMNIEHHNTICLNYLHGLKHSARHELCRYIQICAIQRWKKKLSCNYR